MEKMFVYISIGIISLVSCKKEPEYDANCWWCNACSGEPSPIVSGDVSDFSWSSYNSVHSTCSYLERIVKSNHFPNRNKPVFEHSGDTLKVCGWLYNSNSAILHTSGYWISDDERYASGYEPYPPEFRFGEGIVLSSDFYIIINQLLSASNYPELLQSKCYITGIIKYYLNSGPYDNFPCEWLRLKLDVTDIYFEEDKK